MLSIDKIPNRLANEKSPYLIQHAYNPVAWYPWGDAAFTAARQEDKPIFLSIGYSTCHWCHVMERESFEDDEVAQLLNDNFISIKVDREERPDIDAIYMSACQAFTGQGGWPLTILMTPEQHPFFAGTYLPKHARYGSVGLTSLLTKVAEQWFSDKEALTQSARHVSSLLSQETGVAGEMTETLIDNAYRKFERLYDAKHGGFGGAPKFPAPHQLMFLLRYARRHPDGGALAMAEDTLVSMYRGGIFDHIGYGFSRYSTDAMWLAPHFEKMLYDNALLLMAYTEAYVFTRKELYREVAERIIAYVSGELSSPEGAFYCAQDADSEGEEGKYYTFTADEIRDVLGADADAFMRIYDITDAGNFEGKNIPNLLKCEQYEHADAHTKTMRDKLRAYRLRRTRLNKDDKVLTAWNALMIAALAMASVALNSGECALRAAAALTFIEEHLVETDGRIAVRYRDAQTAGKGVLDDYACLAWAYLEMYRASFDAQYLIKAAHVAEDMIDLFWDERNGGFYMSGADAETLISRPKDTYDGAMPSGNAVAAYVLALLARLTERETFSAVLERQTAYLAGHAVEYEPGHAFALMAAQRVIYPSREIVCVVGNADEKRAVMDALCCAFSPNTTVLIKDDGALDDIAPFTKPYTLKDDKPTYYVCQNGACGAPTHELKETAY